MSTRPLNAYMMWSRTQFQDVKPITERARMAGAAWRAMSDAEKAPWNKKAADAKAKHQSGGGAAPAKAGKKSKTKRNASKSPERKSSSKRQDVDE